MFICRSSFRMRWQKCSQTHVDYRNSLRIHGNLWKSMLSVITVIFVDFRGFPWQSLEIPWTMYFYSKKTNPSWPMMHPHDLISLIIIDIHCFSWIFIDFHWYSLFFMDFHWIFNDFIAYKPTNRRTEALIEMFVTSWKSSWLG